MSLEMRTGDHGEVVGEGLGAAYKHFAKTDAMHIKV